MSQEETGEKWDAAPGPRTQGCWDFVGKIHRRVLLEKGGARQPGESSDSDPPNP